MDLPTNVVTAFQVEPNVPMPSVETRGRFKVESGIPFQPKKRASGHPNKGKSIYPFAKMRPPRPNGDMDSFFVRDTEGKTNKQNSMRIASALHAYRKAHPSFKGDFKYRRVGEGIRVWRVK